MVINGWRLSLLMAACLLCVACASDVGRMVGAKKFNVELLNKGGIVIGGVSANSHLNLNKRLEYAALLEQTIQLREPQLKIIGPKEVFAELGRNLYSQMMDSYSFHETGSTAFMNLLHEKFPDIRYVVYARMEGADVEQRNTPLPNGRGYELQTVRVVGVSMRVFDLHARQLPVWAAGLQQADANSRSVFGKYSEERLKSLYPDPPDTKKLLQKTLTGLVKHLIPKK